MPCSLCNCTTRNFESSNDRDYVQCTGCKAILLAPEFILSSEDEKARYNLHQNDVSDPGYIQFVTPLVNRILKDFEPSARGLDFGCGTGPVITSELEKQGFNIELYDPYFQPNEKALNAKFDFIICCEVMEHFKNPTQEFQLLTSLLNKGGKLYCKTELWDESLDFHNWHYKSDPTHIIFYTSESLSWIKKNIGFSRVEIHPEYQLFTL